MTHVLSLGNKSTVDSRETIRDGDIIFSHLLISAEFRLRVEIEKLVPLTVQAILVLSMGIY